MAKGFLAAPDCFDMCWARWVTNHLPALAVNIAHWLQSVVDGDAGVDLHAVVVQRQQAVLARGCQEYLRWWQRKHLLLQSCQTLASGC